MGPKSKRKSKLLEGINQTAGLKSQSGRGTPWESKTRNGNIIGPHNIIQGKLFNGVGNPFKGAVTIPGQGEGL